jgi:hypothetical protein
VASWNAQAALDDIAATFAEGKVYASVDALAQSLQAQLGALAGADEFLPWVLDNPTFKQRLSGLLSTAEGIHSMTILLTLDTGATLRFVCARLVAALGLSLSGQPGLLSVATAAACQGGAQGLGAPVLIHLSLGDVSRNAR